MTELCHRFRGKTILLTGATDGIGLALAETLADAGARLILIGRRPLDELNAALFSPTNYCQVDLAQPHVADKVEPWLVGQAVHAIDYVIHNAGLGYVGLLSQQSQASITTLLDVNLRAPLALTHRLYPRVAAAKGHIIYISSIAANLPVADYAVYAASKAALESFVRNFQIELAARGAPVTAQTIQIGAVSTGMHAKSGATKARMNWDKFAPVAAVVPQILAALPLPGAKPRRTVTLGSVNRLVAATGNYFPNLTTTLARRSAHPAALESHQILAPDTAAEVADRPVQAAQQTSRHCVITGAASGIGRALAQSYGRAGYTITGIDVDADAAMRTQAELINSGIQARFIVADLAQSEHLASIGVRLHDRPPIDVMIHCAGISAIGRFHTQPWAQQELVLRVNLYAPILLTQRLLQDRRLRPRASLVYISSLSHFTGYPGAAVYAAAKSGLSSFARSLAIGLSDTNLHVLTVYPGPVRTEHARRYSPDNSREHRRMDPAAVADSILHATRAQRASALFPGLLAKLSAALGLWLPGLAEWTMRRTILDKLEQKDPTP